MTLRDLFRWAERYRLSETTDTFQDWEMVIAEDGEWNLISSSHSGDREVSI